MYSPNGLSRGIGYVTFTSLNDAMHVYETHRKDPITFHSIPLIIDYALPKDYENNAPYKVLYVRRLRGYKRELKWYFFTYNRYIKKMMGPSPFFSLFVRLIFDYSYLLSLTLSIGIASF